VQAREHEGIDKWHATLLDGYARRAGQALAKLSCRRAVAWWSDALADDVYLHANLARHLVGCGRYSDLETLLLDHRWTQRQLDVSGLLVLKRDFTLLESSLSLEVDRNAEDDTFAATSAKVIELRRIRDAILLAWGFASKNPRELCFQLHGRLFMWASCGLVKMYLHSVETVTEHAKLAWLKPMGHYLAAPGGRLETVVVLSSPALCVATVPGSNHAVVGDESGAVSLVDIGTSAVVREYGTHDAAVTCIAVSPDGLRVVSGSWDKTVRIWNLKTGKSLNGPLQGHELALSALAVSPDSLRVVSGSRDKTVRVWGMETGEAIGEPMRGHNNHVRLVSVSPDGHRIVSAASDGTIQVWSMGSGRPMGKRMRGSSNMSAAALTPDGRSVVFASAGRCILVFDLHIGQLVGEPMRGHNDRIRSVAVTPDGSRVVSSSRDRTIRVWSMDTLEPIGIPLRGHDRSLWCAALSFDGSRIVSAANDGTLRVWGVENAKVVQEPVREHEQSVATVVAAPDGSSILSGSLDRTIRVWNMDTGQPVGEPLRGHENGVVALAVSQDGSVAVSGSRDKTIRVWCLKTGEAMGDPLLGHTDGVSSVAISKDQSLVASSSRDDSIRIWCLRSRAEVATLLEGRGRSVIALAVSADNAHVVSISRDRNVRVWSLETGQLAEMLRSDSPRARAGGDALLVAGGLAPSSAIEIQDEGGVSLSCSKSDVILHCWNGTSAVVGTLESSVNVGARRSWYYDAKRRRLFAGLYSGAFVTLQLCGGDSLYGGGGEQGGRTPST
jgi:WD40 repeat protein